MYEKLIGESKEYQRLLNEAHKDALDRLQQSNQHNVDALKDVSIAWANKKDSAPVIITGGGNRQVIRSGYAEPGEEDTKVCPGCGRTVEVTSRFCQYCNNEFKDVK